MPPQAREKRSPARPKPHEPVDTSAPSETATMVLGRAARAATVIGLQRLAGNVAVGRALQRCGAAVHAGCACASEEAAVDASDLRAPAVQRAQPVVQRA